MIRRRQLLARFAGGVATAALAPAIVGRAAPATIRFGQIEALTGPSAAYGNRGRDGARLAMDQLNEHGIEIGGTTFQLDVSLGDMANDARQAITLLRQYAAQSDFICAIGPTRLARSRR
jgi:branched-chain amino acid transport system substrate-binding protein